VNPKNTQHVPLGEYLPDLGAVDNQGLLCAKNAIPYANYYDSFKSLVDYTSNTISGIAKGMISTRDTGGTAYTYVGDATALYSMKDASFSDVTRTSGPYNTQTEDMWEFEKWGNRIIATNYTDVIQEITLGATAFDALAGSPPKARHMAVVRDFLVLGNVSDLPSRVQWSAFNNIESWTPSASTQADFQDLHGNGGWIQRIIGGEVGIIFQERSIQRMTYLGGSAIFQFDEIEVGFGTPAPYSVVQGAGGRIFYLGQDDFYVFLGASQPIGHDRVYKTFIDDFDNSYYERVWASTDPFEPLVYWLYPNKDATGGTPNRMLVYNWKDNKWGGPITIDAEIIGIIQNEGYTLEGLDSINTSIDALPHSLDSREYQAETLQLAAMGINKKLQTFTGNELTATFETGDRRPFGTNRARVQNTRPIFEGTSASASVAISARELLDTSASYGATSSNNKWGECPVLSEGRFMRVKMNISGGFTHAKGVDVEAVRRGQY
jgi:hypothetical protein